MKPLKPAVAIVLALFAAGCAGGAKQVREQPARDLSAYYPLQIDNRWTYEVGLLGEKTSQEVRIVGQEGEVFVDDKGGRLTVDAYGVRDDKRYLLRGPIEVGTSWTNVVSVSSIERYRILEVGFTCTAAAGRFEGCVRVEGRNRVDANTTLINELTFAPGVGLVTIETAAEVKGQRIPQAKLELTSYEVHPTGAQ
ncbi:MAG: hypothetical protein WBV82_30540 [Myxococcaceae bacterium]